MEVAKVPLVNTKDPILRINKEHLGPVTSLELSKKKGIEGNEDKNEKGYEDGGETEAHEEVEEAMEEEEEEKGEREEMPVILESKKSK